MVNAKQLDWNQHFDDQQSLLKLSFAGTLSIDTVNQVWQSCFNLLRKDKPSKVDIDLSKVSYCDSAGVGFLLRLKAWQAEQNQQCEWHGLSEQFQPLVTLLTNRAIEPESVITKRESVVVNIGRQTYAVVKVLRENTIYLGELTVEITRCLFNPALVRWRDVWRTMADVGPNALPIVLLLGFLLGLIMSFQSAVPLQKFGAVIYIANIVGISLARELAPLLVAVILAGRTASSFAAEIGTMVVNQEVDALKTMGLKPLLFLAVPRVLAVMAMAPLLSLFMLAIGLIGSGLFMATLGYTPGVFLHQIHTAVTVGDMVGGLFKAFFFGLIIAGIGCMHGLRTRFGASAVGYSTTAAVVSCIVMIVVFDGIFAVTFYALGI